jgi:hypothetical protein
MTKIVKTIKRIESKPVFDITVDESGHYILENGLVSHNSGLKYAASTILFLSKKKDKDSSGEVTGNIIHCKLYKGRFTKENQVVDVRLNYDKGLDKYYGLVDLALEFGIFTKNSTRIVLPDGTSAFEKNIYENPTKYFTPEVMKKLDEAAAKKFKYGNGVIEAEILEEEDGN